MNSIILMMLFPLIFAEFQVEENLKILTDTNFNEFILSAKRTLVFFYTPGCGPCDEFKPKVEKAAFLLEEEGIPFGKFDAETNKDVAKQYSVNGYPTLLYFENGVNKTKFEGTRSPDGIQMFVYEKMNPGSTQLNTLDDVRATIDLEDCVFIFFGDDPKDRVFRRFREFSFTVSNAVFAHTFVNGALKSLGLSERAQVVAFKKYDKSPVIFQSKQLKIPELQAFAEINMIPRVSDWSSELEKRIFKKNRDALILFTNGDNKDVDQAYQQLAQGFPIEDYILFIKITPQSKFWKEVTERIGIWEAQIRAQPKLLMLKTNGTRRYELENEFNPKNIEQFIFEVRADKVPRYFKSAQDFESLPIHELANLEVLNSKRYHKEVLQSNLDWVVIYYNSTNESHFKSQEQLRLINRVAKKLIKNTNLKFGITEVSQNEYNDFDESLDQVIIRLYKGAGGQKQFKRFPLKTNKLQEDRLVNFLFEHTR